MKKMLLILLLSCVTAASAPMTTNSSWSATNGLRNAEVVLLPAPRYILTLSLKQSHFSLSITTHIKDSMNEVEFQIPVDKQYYDSLKEGDLITDQFRTGSLLLSGSFGSWKVSVKKKEIK